jgi:hypothetical protein
MAVVAAVVVAAVVAAAAAAVVVAEEEVVVVVVAVAEVAVAVEPTTMMTNQTVTFYSFLIVGFISIVNTFDEKKFRRKSLKIFPDGSSNNCSLRISQGFSIMKHVWSKQVKTFLLRGTSLTLTLNR